MWKVKTFRVLLAIKEMLDHHFGLSEFSLVERSVSYFKQKWFSDYYSASVDRLVVSLGGFDLLLPKSFVFHYVFHEYEPITQKTFVKWLKPGMTVIDIGAHIGFYTVVAAKKVGKTGKVHAMEPCSETLEFLTANISLNKLTNVEVHPFAAGREHTRRMFHITGSSDSHGFYSHPNTPTIRTIEVEQVRLDEIVQGRVDAIKIDVEGAEIEVLDGMTGIFADNGQLSLWVEWFPAGMKNAGYVPIELPNYLRSLGFSDIQVIDEGMKELRSVEEIDALIQSGSLADSWHANIWAKRART